MVRGGCLSDHHPDPDRSTILAFPTGQQADQLGWSRIIWAASGWSQIPGHESGGVWR